MAKDATKKRRATGKRSATKRRSGTRSPPRKIRKKTARRAGTRPAAPPSDDTHHAVFASLAARSNEHAKAPLCYQQLASGAWLIYFLQGDGSYGQPQPYSGPIHEPACG